MMRKNHPSENLHQLFCKPLGLRNGERKSQLRRKSRNMPIFIKLVNQIKLSTTTTVSSQ
jgi:hypothetical protein